MARPDADGNPSIARHLRNLGFVPSEYQDVGRVHEDPDELGYTFIKGRTNDVKAMEPHELLGICNSIIPEHERAEITQAALLCNAGHQHNAERHRAAAGYDGL